jgi:DMSO/TMAO reductase YedYZ heme-binding membrane subunit
MPKDKIMLLAFLVLGATYVIAFLSQKISLSWLFGATVLYGCIVLWRSLRPK